jgi:hypothetical protein
MNLGVILLGSVIGVVLFESSVKLSRFTYCFSTDTLGVLSAIKFYRKRI